MELSFLCAALLLLAFFTAAGPAVFAATAISVIIHEAGHLIALRMCGVGAKKVAPTLFGVLISYCGVLPYTADALCAASGPLSGLLLALAASICANAFGCEFCCTLCGASLVLSVFNLLPVCPLDGGRILYACIAKALGEERGRKISAVCSLCISALLTASGIYIYAILGSGGALAVGAWLFVSSCKNAKNSVQFLG